MPGTEDEALAGFAERVRAAMGAPDLEAFGALLHPSVTWGPPDDPVSGCHNRGEVVAWYSRARAAGMQGHVSEIAVGDGALLVGITVRGTPAAHEAGGEADRWQVLTVRDGRIVDIRGFADRAEAAARAGLSR